MEKITRRDREKQLRKDLIISAAQRLFTEKGYENTTVDEVAAAAEFTKRTVYRYFYGKDDLYFAVALKAFKTMARYAAKTGRQDETGLEKMQAAFKGFYRFYREKPGLFKIINEIGCIKQRATPHQSQWLAFDDKMFKSIGQIIIKGQRDGSIRSDLDPRQAALSCAFMITGFFHQLQETGRTFTAHFNLPENEFVEYSIDMLLGSVKAG